MRTRASLVTVDLERGDRLGDAVDLRLAQLGHVVVVVGVVGDVAGAVGLLEAADAVLEPGVPGMAHGRASVRSSRSKGRNSSPFGSANRTTFDRSGRSSTAGEAPRLGAVGEVAVGQQQNRGPVRERDPGRLHGRVEALAGVGGRDDRDGRLAVAAEHRLEEVGLLGLRRQTGGRTAALDVHDDERELHAHRETDGLALQGDPRARGRGHREVAAEGGTERRPDAGDLVLGLEGADPEVLVPGQLVEDVARRRDRVPAEEQRQPGALRRGDEPVGQREVAGDLPVLPGGAPRASPRRSARTSRSSRRRRTRP
jgi:hypothetical protein